MATILSPGLGRHVTTLTVTMQSVHVTTGVLTDSAVVAALITSTGTINSTLVHTANKSDDIEWAIRHNTEAIQSITRGRIHNAPTTIGGTFRLAELVARGTNVNGLATCWFQGPSRIAKLSFFFGGAGGVLYARMRSFRMTPVKTKNVDIAEFVLIDANTDPTYLAGER